jgi:8-oxo-dGTP pyrophosphatase MutT (NUDIX family)
MVALVTRCIDDDELFTVLVQQPRIGCGQMMYEFPAGMADDSRDVAAIAACEVEEEVGIACAKEDLIAISELYRPHFPQTYSSPEHFEQNAHAFLLAKRMSKAEIEEYEGRHCGVGQDEQITLHVVPFANVIRYAFEPATLAVTLMIIELLEKGIITI